MPSHLREVEALIPLSLSPSCLKKNGNVKDGIDEQLNQYLMKYNEELGGVVLSYRKVCVDDEYCSNETGSPRPAGMLIQGFPWIQIDVKVHMLLFSPHPGHSLHGVVQSLGPDHVNLLVHGVFNVSIFRDGLPDVYQYDYDKDVWRGASQTDLLQSGVKLNVKVLRLKPGKDGMLSLSGSIKGPGLGVLDASEPGQSEKTETKEREAKKSKKKSKKDKARKMDGDSSSKKKKRKSTADSK